MQPYPVGTRVTVCDEDFTWTDYTIWAHPEAYKIDVGAYPDMEHFYRVLAFKCVDDDGDNDVYLYLIQSEDSDEVFSIEHDGLDLYERFNVTHVPFDSTKVILTRELDSSLRVGSKVMLRTEAAVNYCYSQFKEWLERHGISTDKFEAYRLPAYSDEYVIVAKGVHSVGSDRKLCGIKSLRTGKVFVMEMFAVVSSHIKRRADQQKTLTEKFIKELQATMMLDLH